MSSNSGAQSSLGFLLSSSGTSKCYFAVGLVQSDKYSEALSELVDKCSGRTESCSASGSSSKAFQLCSPLTL